MILFFGLGSTIAFKAYGKILLTLEYFEYSFLFYVVSFISGQPEYAFKPGMFSTGACCHRGLLSRIMLSLVVVSGHFVFGHRVLPTRQTWNSPCLRGTKENRKK